MNLRQMGSNKIIPYLPRTIYTFGFIPRKAFRYNPCMRRNSFFTILTLFILSVSSCKNFGIEDMQFTGLQKDEVIQLLGEPDETEDIVKNAEHIFGPIEGLWYQIEIGEKIVIWRYESWNGYKELYFINDWPEVFGEFFWYKDSRKNPVF